MKNIRIIWIGIVAIAHNKNIITGIFSGKQEQALRVTGPADVLQ